MKTCCYCKESKDESLFGVNRNSSDKLTSDCSSCRRIRQRERRANKPENKEKRKLWYQFNREKVIAKTNNWRNNNKEHFEKKSKEWKEANRDKIRGAFLRRKYWPDVSSEQALNNYNNLVIKFNNSCGICKKHRDSFDKDLCVDHNHVTGEIRGLLCHSCNNMLGLLKVDDPGTSLLNSTFEYICKSNSESIQ
jgi:hypothetical protein